MNDKQKVLSLIPTGRENSVTKGYLMTMTGLPDRRLRQCIEDLRNEGNFIINDSNGFGYYISDDLKDLERQYKNDTARALSILKRRKHIRAYLVANGIKVK